jgi:hypothetical protein
MAVDIAFVIVIVEEHQVLPPLRPWAAHLRKPSRGRFIPIYIVRNLPKLS